MLTARLALLSAPKLERCRHAQQGNARVPLSASTGAQRLRSRGGAVRLRSQASDSGAATVLVSLDSILVRARARASAAHPERPLHLHTCEQRPRPRPRPDAAWQEQIRETGDADGALELRAVELLRASGLRGFGTGRLTPKRDYTLAEMRLNKVEPGAFLSPRDTTLEGVRTQAAAALAAGTLAIVAATHPSSGQLLAGSVGALTLLMVDQVGNGGAAEALVLDSLGRATSAAYRKRVARHESGHFLVAWLCGILPRAYTLSAWDALQREGALNVQAGTQFADKAFQSEVAGGKLSSASLDIFCCIALAGIASEVIAFGQAEGGLNDVRQLDGLLQALAFTQKRADSQVRWAALATTALLRRHTAAHDALEAAMVSGASVGTCIGVLERHLSEEL